MDARGAALILLGALLLPSPWISAQERVTRSNPGANQELWTITQPTVSKPTTTYNQIELRLGDQVRIMAGGCVQTGGSGLTWKLYVSPQGPNTDRFYYGMIYLPGFSKDWESDSPLAGFQKIKNIQGREIEIKAPDCSPRADCKTYYKGDIVGHLQLGYVDNDYHDNGYNNHDEGTNGQCRDVGPAWVTINISRYQAERPDTSSRYQTDRSDIGGTWTFTMVSSVSGRTYTGSLQLRLDGTNLSGNLLGPEVTGNTPVTGSFDAASGSIRLTRDTGLDTLQKYVLTGNGNRYRGAFHNEGKYPDSGSFEIMR
jgi:hypothetical protein